MTSFNLSSVSTKWFYHWRGAVAMAKMPGYEHQTEYYQREAVIAQTAYVLNAALETQKENT